jgi:hypothetical protein
MEINAHVRRIVACGGGILAGTVVGSEFSASDGDVKGILAGLGVGLLFATLVPDDTK